MHETDAHFFNLEASAPDAPVRAGRHLLHGWLAPKPAYHFTDVRARLGARIFRGVYGYARADLAAYFKSARPHLLAGFTIEVVLPPGPAVLALDALDSTGHWQPFHTVVCLATAPAPAETTPAAPLDAADFAGALRLWLKGGATAAHLAEETPWPRTLRDEHPPFHGHLAEPTALARAPFGQMLVNGWLFHEMLAVRRAFVTTDLIDLHPLETGGPYAQVQERFPSFPHARNCRLTGFASIPAQLPGPAAVRIFVELEDGSFHLALAVLCRALGTEELKASYPVFSGSQCPAGWRALRGAWARRRVPLEDERLLRREAGKIFREYEEQAPPPLHSGETPALPAPGASRRPRRLLLITHNLNHEGAPLFLLEWARHFARQEGAGILLLSPQDGKLRPAFEELGAEVRVIDAGALYQSPHAAVIRRTVTALARTIDWSGIDLVVANTLVSCWGVPLAHAAGKPALLYIHESTTPAAFFRAGFGRGVLPAAYAALRTAEAVSFIASPARAYYEALSTGANYRTTPGWINVTVIDEYRAAHSRAALRAKLGLRADELLVINLGTVCERKGQHVFVNSIELLWRRDPALAARCRFLLVGARDDPYNQRLRTLTAGLNRPNIEFVPETGGALDYFHAADLFACTSYEEAFPRVVLEAMAFALPIVASGVHGIPDMVRDEVEAILVPPGDTEALLHGLVRFLGAPEEARRWGARARARVERDFRTEVVMPAHSALVSGLAAAGR